MRLRGGAGACYSSFARLRAPFRISKANLLKYTAEAALRKFFKVLRSERTGSTLIPNKRSRGVLLSAASGTEHEQRKNHNESYERKVRDQVTDIHYRQ